MKQTLARIDFLRQGGRLVTKMTLIMLNSLLKTGQNDCAVDTRKWPTARKTCALATASASGYKVCYTWATRTASCKRRSNWPLPSGFLLVETALNNFHPIIFLVIAMFCHIQMVQNFRFHRALVWHFVHQWGVYLGFTALRHNPLSVCGNTIVKQNCIWKIVVRRMQDVRCMTSITPCAEEKEYFCLLTMQLWFSKSNSV